MKKKMIITFVIIFFLIIYLLNNYLDKTRLETGISSVEYSISNIYYKDKEETEYPEKIYEDESYVYYLPYYKSENIIIEYRDNYTMNLKDALTQKKITIDNLIEKLKIIVVEEKRGGNVKSVANIPNMRFLSGKNAEELKDILLSVPKDTIYKLWGQPTGRINGWDYEYWDFSSGEHPIIISYDSDENIDNVINTLRIGQDEFCLSNDDFKVLLNYEMPLINKKPIEIKNERMDGYSWTDYKYDNIELRESPSFESNAYNMITKIVTTSSDYKTTRGIKVGDSLETLEIKYNNLKKTMISSNETICVYDPQDDWGTNKIYFELKNNTITKITMECSEE